MATRPHGARVQVNPWRVAVVGLSAALIGLGSWVLVDHYPGTSSNATAMSTDVALRYIAVATAGNFDASLYTPNALFLDKGTGEVTRGRDAVAASWQAVADTPGYRWRGNFVFATPSRAVVSWELSASTNPYTGEPFTANGVSTLEIDQGAIAREIIYWNVP